MDHQVFLSKDALMDLEMVVAYIAPHNPDAARRMGDRLLDAALSLGAFPGRGRVVPEFGRSELREIIVRSYRVIYRWADPGREIEIVRFWHGARGLPQIPRGA